MRSHTYEQNPQFESEQKIPIYIVIGLGGVPVTPNKMFLIPLKKINSYELSLKFLNNYEINPNGKFMWQVGSFWNSGYLEATYIADIFHMSERGIEVK